MSKETHLIHLKNIIKLFPKAPRKTASLKVKLMSFIETISNIWLKNFYRLFTTSNLSPNQDNPVVYIQASDTQRMDTHLFLSLSGLEDLKISESANLLLFLFHYS